MKQCFKDQNGGLYEMTEEMADDFEKKNPKIILTIMKEEDWKKQLVEYGGV